MLYSVDMYIEVAKSTEVFKPAEITILKEVLSSLSEAKKEGYIFFDEIIDGVVAGFVIMGKTPLTDFSWDIYWMVVHKDFQNKGIGRRLIQRAERKSCEEGASAVLRVETSTRREYACARMFYTKHGYEQVGIIDDFYAQDDGLVIFSKRIIQN